MRIVTIGLLVFGWNCAAWGQDPTMPSPAILQRLNSNSSVSATDETRQTVKLSLKAIVFSDRDHATCLIEVDGRLVRISLDRTEVALQIESMRRRDAEPTARSSNIGVQVGGSFYCVEEFNSNFITLFDGSHRIQVQ